MKFQVGFTDGALSDVRKAQTWYENKVLGLGKRFADAVGRQAKSLKNLPEKYKQARDDIRVCSVPRFPYEL